MAARMIRTFVCAISFVVIGGWERNTQGSPTFTVTDLGRTLPTYRSNESSTGFEEVVNTDTGSRYVFVKSAVDFLNEKLPVDGHPDDYTMYTMRNGPYKTGYRWDNDGGSLGEFKYGLATPVFESPDAGWGYLFYQRSSPVYDINSQGQVVGASQKLKDPAHIDETYAAFSDLHGLPHGYDPTDPSKSLAASVTDNLNNYIAANLGVDLLKAFSIDDQGQIVAWGVRDGEEQYFLLTPDGQPIQIPEPSTLAILSLSVLASGARRPRGLMLR